MHVDAEQAAKLVVWYIRIMPGQRVIGRVRLSRNTDESTSVERQKEIIEAWVKANENILIGWAEDVDVSGSVSPFEAPELGPWLTEDRKDEWDIICSWKLDRVSRRVILLNQLFGWLQENNKVLVCVSDNIDLSTWVGRLIANVIAGVAEGELEAIAERTRSSRKKLREIGRWGGGRVAYGHLPVQTEVGWVLAVDEEAAKVIDEIADLYLDGRSADWIADDLNDRGVLSPLEHFRTLRGLPNRGGKWHANGIRFLMQNKALLGHVTFQQETVRDDDGMPLLYSEPVMSKEKFDRVQAAIEARRTGPARTRKTSPMLGVAFCYDCGSQLAHRVMNRDYGTLVYRYYHCREKGCPSKTMMYADEVEKMLEESFLEDVGGELEMTRTWIRASDHTAELEEAREAVKDLSNMLTTAKSKTMKATLARQLESLDTRIEALEQLPVRKGGYEYKETGRTYAQAWEEAHTPENRRQLLLKYGVTCRVQLRSKGQGENEKGIWAWDLNVPADLRARMTA
ncbi:recombinase family protein [Nocardia sp. IFM 10818]